MRRLLPLLLAAASGLGLGCTAVVHGAPLSGRSAQPRGVYLSTGGSPRPYRTLGFIQVTGYGVEVAGVANAGDAALDSVLQTTLSHEAAKMGADGIIHITFLDENPSTPLEKYQSAARSVQNIASGTGGVETKNRTVHATGELIVFLD
ncbi:MAG: hypothetical protein P1V51_04720 [Deltaproteobacteria bacterium]|nr:hypothetical protein [Deltaproteobacteria bacterium]